MHIALNWSTFNRIGFVILSHLFFILNKKSVSMLSSQTPNHSNVSSNFEIKPILLMTLFFVF